MARIMIVDDSDQNRKLMSDMLKSANHETVAEADNGIEAVKKFNDAKPDLLLLDISMPKKDGIAVLKEIIATNPTAKVIMITVSDEQEIIEECVTAGACAYIVKPFAMEDFIKTVSYALEKEEDDAAN